MGQFIVFINIKTVHPYYANMTGNLRFLPTIKTEQLMRSREILFRQTRDGCQWLLSNDCAGFLKGDEFELVLLMQDTNFIRITQLEDYRPQSFYQLALPENSREIDVASALVPTKEPKRESHFCHISIKLTDNMLKEAKSGRPPEYLLRFREAAYRWEFLLVPRQESTDESKTFLLEDTNGQILFTLPEKEANISFSKIAWRIVSVSPVVCREHPDCNLRLSEVQTAELSKRLSEVLSKDIQPEDFSKLPPEILSGVLPGILADRSLKKRTVSRFLPFPEPGKYNTDQQDCIRQICYV